MKIEDIKNEILYLRNGKVYKAIAYVPAPSFVMQCEADGEKVIVIPGTGLASEFKRIDEK